jgi:hypothetical protein
MMLGGGAALAMGPQRSSIEELMAKEVFMS